MFFSRLIFIIRKYFFIYPVGFYSLNKEWLLYLKLLKPKSQNKSIIFFTTHKCASTFFDIFFKETVKESGLVNINFDEFKGRYEGLLSLDKIYEKSPKDKGFSFAPVRAYQKFANKESYKVILCLRDPRDVLVSLYYSMMYSHTVNSNKILNVRNNYKDKIDDFVISYANKYFDIYTEYMHELDDYFFINYTDLIKNPKKILLNTLEYLEINLPIEKVNKYSISLQNPIKENIYNHKRSGKSGQYKTHLNKKTIEKLNIIFSDINNFYNFE